MTIDPVVLFFLLGLAAGLSRADLRLPPAIYEFLTILLLLAIGLKGGVELAAQPFAALLPQMLTVILTGVLLPLAAYPVLRVIGGLARADAASIAAHYGSVSVGTYAVAVAYLAFRQVAFEEYVAVFLVLLEMPAIVVGVLLARGVSRTIVFGITMPVVSGLFGAGLGWTLGLSVGGTAVMATLIASASYTRGAGCHASVGAGSESGSVPRGLAGRDVPVQYSVRHSPVPPFRRVSASSRRLTPWHWTIASW